jgi:hypothetical protein
VIVRYVPSTPFHLPAHDSTFAAAGDALGLADGETEGDTVGLGTAAGGGVSFFSGVHAPPINTTAKTTKHPKSKIPNPNLNCLLILFLQKIVSRFFLSRTTINRPRILVPRPDATRQRFRGSNRERPLADDNTARRERARPPNLQFILRAKAAR